MKFLKNLKLKMAKKTKDPKWQRKALIVGCIILAVVLVLIIAAGLIMNYLFGNLNFKDPASDTTISAEDASSIAMEEWETIDPNDDTPLYDPDDIIFNTEGVTPLNPGKHIVNILLVGQDARPGEGTQRSDSMILVTFNKSKKTITLTSFMRDEYVQIPGYGATKLCHAYQYGGMTLLNQTLFNHYGLQIDGNVEVDFTGFEDIIDMLGGVSIDLTSKEANHLNKLEGWNLSQGTNRLSGEQALLYARIRSIDTDYARTERQRKVVMSVMNEYKSQSLSKMLELLEDILPLITTNMSESKLMNYTMDMFSMASGAQINTMRLPVDGTFDEGYIRVSEGMRVWCQMNIDFAANHRVLKDLFSE